MGWFGYGLYDGDDTQTYHIKFIKTAIPSLSINDILEFLHFRKTKIPDNFIAEFKKGVPHLLKKIKTPTMMKWTEDNAIEWQMLLSLFTDNNLIVPHKVLVYGTLANYYLLGTHAEDFSEPAKRRSTIRRFMKKVDTLFCSVKARKEILKRINY